MKSVFLDTVGFLALWDEDDQWHPLARKAYLRLKESRVHLLTTTTVLLECGNAAARRPYRAEVARMRREMEASGDLISPNLDDWEQAWHDFEQNTVDDAGIVDHLSFRVMHRLGIDTAFTHNHHFHVAGFRTLF